MVSDMMADETQSIRESSRPLKKYGSTCNHIKRPDNCIKHVISQGDTLQGIALRYGATMEQIRRLNRLWASDSLFLREHLLIPVPADASSQHLVLDVSTFESSPPGGGSSSSEAERSIDEFLDQIDSSIASTKSQVKKVQGNSEFREDGGDLFVRRKAPKSRLRQHHNNHHSQAGAASSSGDPLAAPHPVVMTQGRKVRSSLQRLEREQDEIFEL